MEGKKKVMKLSWFKTNIMYRYIIFALLDENLEAPSQPNYLVNISRTIFPRSYDNKLC